MAAKEQSQGERKYIIPLRKGFNKVPRYQRTSKSIKLIRNFILKHMKVNEVKLSKELNLYMWSRGRQHPPVKIEVKTIKEEDYARVQLPNLEFEKRKEKKAKKAETFKEKIQEKVGSLKGEETKAHTETVKEEISKKPITEKLTKDVKEKKEVKALKESKENIISESNKQQKAKKVRSN